jgi:hypothetical protein
VKTKDLTKHFFTLWAPYQSNLFDSLFFYSSVLPKKNNLTSSFPRKLYSTHNGNLPSVFSMSSVLFLGKECVGKCQFSPAICYNGNIAEVLVQKRFYQVVCKETKISFLLSFSLSSVLPFFLSLSPLTKKGSS